MTQVNVKVLKANNEVLGEGFGRPRWGWELIAGYLKIRPREYTCVL